MASYLIKIRIMVFNATFNNISAISWVVAGCIKSHNKYSFTVLMKMEEIFHKHTIPFASRAYNMITFGYINDDTLLKLCDALTEK
jgi:hypothetical protein